MQEFEMPRAIWKGTISFGLVTIPVGLFSAVSAEDLSFHLLDSRDFSAVHNKRVNEGTGEEVPWEAIVKGYQLPDGHWVTVTDDDFAAANVKATRTIDVLGAVCEDDIAVNYFDTPYFLVPEPQGAKAYALHRDSLTPAAVCAGAARRRAGARGHALPLRAARKRCARTARR
jgi:DNA end-binding protein Ku